jgi:hypothetical protein
MGRFLNYCILTALFFTSCGTKHPGEKKTTLASHLLGISDNEDKGIKEIIGLYGGECEYGFSKSTGNNTENLALPWAKKSDCSHFQEERFVNKSSFFLFDHFI